MSSSKSGSDPTTLANMGTKESRGKIIVCVQSKGVMYTSPRDIPSCVSLFKDAVRMMNGDAKSEPVDILKAIVHCIKKKRTFYFCEEASMIMTYEYLLGLDEQTWLNFRKKREDAMSKIHNSYLKIPEKLNKFVKEHCVAFVPTDANSLYMAVSAMAHLCMPRAISNVSITEVQNMITSEKVISVSEANDALAQLTGREMRKTNRSKFISSTIGALFYTSALYATENGITIDSGRHKKNVLYPVIAAQIDKDHGTTMSVRSLTPEKLYGENGTSLSLRRVLTTDNGFKSADIDAFAKAVRHSIAEYMSKTRDNNELTTKDAYLIGLDFIHIGYCNFKTDGKLTDKNYVGRKTSGGQRSVDVKAAVLIMLAMVNRYKLDVGSLIYIDKIAGIKLSTLQNKQKETTKKKGSTVNGDEMSDEESDSEDESSSDDSESDAESE